jgi:uncharacterized protein with LGFP repeats
MRNARLVVFLTMTIVAACLQAGSLAVSPALAEQLTAAGGASSPPVYQGTITDSFSDPEGVSLDGSDLLVTDTGNSRVVELKTDGTEVNTWGSAGSGAGQLYSPRQAVADSGQIDVSDSFNNRVDTFPTAGGPAGQFAGSLSTPRGIASRPTVRRSRWPTRSTTRSSSTTRPERAFSPPSAASASRRVR